MGRNHGLVPRNGVEEGDEERHMFHGSKFMRGQPKLRAEKENLEA